MKSVHCDVLCKQNIHVISEGDWQLTLTPTLCKMTLLLSKLLWNYSLPMNMHYPSKCTRFI